jgi:hypothetical protein
VPLEDVGDVAWVVRHVPAPAAETAVLVDRAHPLLEETPLGPVLVGILPLVSKTRCSPVASRIVTVTEME